MDEPEHPAVRPARPLRSRAVAALAWGLLLFAAVQGALNLAMERRPELRDPEYASKRARLRARRAGSPDRPLVVMVGSSRALFAFRPSDLPPCGAPAGDEPLAFNCSLVGAGPLMELVCLRRLLADGVRPDWLFVECWPPAEVTTRVLVERLAWDDLGTVSRYNPRPRQLYREWGQFRLLPWFSDRGLLMGRYAPGWRPPAPESYLGIDDAGWMACPFGATPAERDRLSRAVPRAYGPSLEHFRHPEGADRAYREILATCRQEGIGAALVVLPEARWFRDLYPAAARAEVADYLDRLSRDCQVPVIDARDWAADEDFADGYHLLPGGATAFTARFGVDVLRPLLAGRTRAALSP